MNLVLLLIVGTGAAWFVYRALMREAKEGKCAGCTKACGHKNSCS